MTLWDRARAWWQRDVPLSVYEAPLPPDRRECPCCHAIVFIWHTYSDGQIRCVDCRR